MTGSWKHLLEIRDGFSDQFVLVLYTFNILTLDSDTSHSRDQISARACFRLTSGLMPMSGLKTSGSTDPRMILYGVDLRNSCVKFRLSFNYLP